MAVTFSVFGLAVRLAARIARIASVVAATVATTTTVVATDTTDTAAAKYQKKNDDKYPAAVATKSANATIVVTHNVIPP